ncbi:hypothetical protein CgunFtcFv8_015967 [Champsocephalus gunnari]|uniref:Uncharacterized protein n=1 Tax=Champsocephalus gunnari TaxID=52237 RepID=A0AAN8C7N6_CHAGU|nr:hypothetical protein CgunFtcFv8_015967 [Champsocephalus gunnari]
MIITLIVWKGSKVTGGQCAGFRRAVCWLQEGRVDSSLSMTAPLESASKPCTRSHRGGQCRVPAGGGL